MSTSKGTVHRGFNDYQTRGSSWSIWAGRGQGLAWRMEGQRPDWRHLAYAGQVPFKDLECLGVRLALSEEV